MTSRDVRWRTYTKVESPQPMRAAECMLIWRTYASTCYHGYDLYVQMSLWCFRYLSRLYGRGFARLDNGNEYPPINFVEKISPVSQVNVEGACSHERFLRVCCLWKGLSNDLSTSVLSITDVKLVGRMWLTAWSQLTAILVLIRGHNLTIFECTKYIFIFFIHRKMLHGFCLSVLFAFCDFRTEEVSNSSRSELGVVRWSLDPREFY